jgi:hypothetical protein
MPISDERCDILLKSLCLSVDSSMVFLKDDAMNVSLAVQPWSTTQHLQAIESHGPKFAELTANYVSQLAG